jgi:dsRNA-specific ribonuclease
MFSLVISSSLAATYRVVEELIEPKIVIITRNRKQADRKRVYSAWADGLPVFQYAGLPVEKKYKNTGCKVQDASCE